MTIVDLKDGDTYENVRIPGAEIKLVGGDNGKYERERLPSEQL